MTMHQHPQQTAFTASPTSFRNVAPRSPPNRPALPDRDVTSATIEDAFVAFILYCNPIFPPDGADTAALRDLFRLPPRSGGKSFSTFTLFELIKQLELTKELKTWAELALKLGVDPPDQEKGQSSQKIQQYAVRLKRWMHSARVDAFFAYLMDRPHSYWMDIPADPVSTMRDGVAPEDDMALRALLPQIKPRRGRRRPEDDDADQSPSQRPSPLAGDEIGVVQADCLDAWSAADRSRYFFADTFPQRPSAAPSVSPWMSRDVLQTPTPLSAYPQVQSAITPATNQPFWPETSHAADAQAVDTQAGEPKSAIVPPKMRATSKRHGAKVVSSAWRSGRAGTSGKTRGRPPINRGGNEGPFSAFPTTETQSFRVVPPTHVENNELGRGMSHTIPRSATDVLAPPVAPGSGLPTSTTTTPSTQTMQQQSRSASQSSVHAAPEPSHNRPAKRSRLSLQVPERVGGAVRLATPPPPPLPRPPPVDAADEDDADQDSPQEEGPDPKKERSSFLRNIVHQAPEEPGPRRPTTEKPTPVRTAGSSGTAGAANTRSSTQAAWTVMNIDITTNRWKPVDPFALRDRTNTDELEGYFMHEILTAAWYDPQDNPILPCGPDEGWALCSAVLDHVRKQHTENKIYLLNLAALAGSSILQDPATMRVKRYDDVDRTTYECTWQLRLGEVRSTNNLKLTIPHNRWKRPDPDDRSTTVGADETNPEVLTAEYWQQKYMGLVFALHKKAEQIKDIRAKLVPFLRAGPAFMPEEERGSSSAQES